MLKLRDLALRSDFEVGPLLVSPARRHVSGPAGEVHLEPLIMQVFLLLLETPGRVVTRDELFDQCWGGVIVGDDSLNRVIGKVRRIDAETAPGLFEIETIPRTGYRLTGDILAWLPRHHTAAKQPPRQSAVSRRMLLGAGGAAALLGVGGGTLWLGSRDGRYHTLVEQAQDAVVNGADPARLLEEAIALRPDRAEAVGLLAFSGSIKAQSGDPAAAPRHARQAYALAEKALAIDAREANALLAIWQLQGSTLDWTARDEGLRRILAIDSTNVNAIAQLVLFLQAAGLTRESWHWNERAIALEPLSVDFLGKRGLKLWILGRLAEADKVIDQVRALDPGLPWSWWIRFMTYAFSNRAAAARAMLDASPNMIPDEIEASIWRMSLAAFERRSRQSVNQARDAWIDGARASGGLAGQAVMALSALGEVDAAFAVADGFLLSRGPVVRNGRPPLPGDLSDAVWRVHIQGLFTPPAAAMRADSRFLMLCDEIGLTGYWRARRVKPDYLKVA